MMPYRVIFNRQQAHASNRTESRSAWNPPEFLSKRLGGIIHRTTDETTKEKGKLSDLVANSEKVLLKVKGVFPFDFFPDSVIIDVNKVNIIKRSFFLSHRLHSISIKSITEIYAQMSPFFGSLSIVDAAMNPGNKLSVKYLHKADAARARRLIQGLVDANKQGIDLSKMTADEIIDNLEQVGKIRTQ